MLQDWKWTPEVLSLFLLLSHSPAKRSRKEDGILLEPDEPKSLVDEFANEEPIFVEEDTGLWKNVNFGADGSDDSDGGEAAFSEEPREQTISESSFVQEADPEPETLILPHIETDVNILIQHQLWRQGAEENKGRKHDPEQSEVSMTELQTVREIIHMLLDLPTTIFVEKCNGTTIECREISIKQLSPSSVNSLLQKFSLLGAELRRVRHFVNRKENAHLVQRFQSLLSYRLKIIDDALNELQSSILHSSVGYVVSLLDLYERASQITRYIRHLIPTLRDSREAHELRKPFGILEGLFDATCAAQKMGDADLYDCAAKIFLGCFTMYLKPLQSWIESGDLDENDQEMFIKRNNVSVTDDSVWQNQFSIRRNGGGAVFAPTFLHVATSEIFKAGKSVYLLKILGQQSVKEDVGRQSENAGMLFENICRQDDSNLLSPFPELFDAALNAWITRHHLSASTRLRQVLDQTCGLSSCLDAFEYLYFSKDGILSNLVLTPVFDRLDGHKKHWDDPVIIADLCRKSFANISAINVENVKVKSGHVGRRQLGRSMNILERLDIDYQLPWPLANILHPSSVSTYQRILVFLAQLHRAKYLLRLYKLPIQNRYRSTASYVHTLYSYSSRLLYFTNAMLTHLLIMVLDANTVKMRLDMAQAEDIDAMISIHQKYIAKLEDQCFLHKKHASLKQAILSILDLTVLFSDIVATVAEDYSPDTGVRTSEGSVSSSDDEDDENRSSGQFQRAREGSALNGQGSYQGAAARDAKLNKIRNTFKQLHAFITTSITGLSKADGAPCWEVLASSLFSGRSGS
ncbi:uncharacterized protein KY384_005460 [Bacidia gigantensis]|uniref:uncharacterized protein n=1 Tax=Bacidia gigantensis TaxID=2732470 RepID=UPI001D03D7A7|nr:uncharacterized protein KY384_005460 [Bacidia gigantensis]KAG8529978.1 hypothetical protein KY384_005460 [Bacidia gigantensis]